MSIKLVMTFKHLILCHSLLLLPSVFSSIRVFFSESALCIRFPKYWSFSFSISPSSEYSGLISFRMDWLDPSVQGTLKSLHSTTVQKHQFFGFQPFLWSKIPWRREWLPTPVSWPPEFHGLYSLWGCKEPGMTEWFPLSFFSHPTLIPTRWT